MSDPSLSSSSSSSSSSSTLSVGSSTSSSSTSTSTSNTNDSVRPRGFHSRLSSLDETRKATWMPAEVENFDELDALEDRIRTTDLIKDHNMDKSPQCPKTVNGGALVSWFISQKLAANRQAALALGQRLVDAHKMFNVEPRTNRRLHQDFDGDPDSLWRFEVDRACGADPVRAYSLTKFYFAKINSHSGHLHCVGIHRLTPFFGVLSREDCTIYMFRNPEAGKPYDDVYLKRAAYFIADQMETPHSEKKHKEDVGRRGSYLGLVTSSRNVLLACPSPQARDQWVAELDKVHMKLIEPPAKVSAETVNQIVYDNNMFPPHTPKTPIGTARNLSLISEAPSPQLIDQLLHDTERVKLNDSASLSPRGRGTASTTTSLSSAASSSSASSSSAATSATATAAANANVGAAGAGAGAGAGNKTGTSTASSFTPRSATGSGASNDATEAKQSNFDPTSEAWKTQRAATEAKRQLSLMIPFLGFSFDAVEENDNPFDGLLVDVVEPDTPAERAGLRRGDVVLQVNGMRTLTLPDLKHAIRNQYPGACLDVFGERDSKPLHLAMIIGAKGVPDEHVAQLRAIIEEAEKYAQGAPIAHTPKNLEEDESGVTLADVLETPQWRMVLLNYMEINLCAESLNFLTAEQAYQRIPDSQSERRSYAARLICDEFIDERGDQMVNLDNDTRKTVMAKISLGDFAPMLFHEAAKVVYKMVETDVFRRFIHTEEYKEMLSDPFINQSESLQKHRRKANSFVVIALEERTSELDLIAAEFTKTGVVQDRRYHLKKYKSCFTGAQLVDFLIEQGYCKNRPGGVSVGQRMHDANILRHVNDECEFEDSDKFFTFLRSSVSEGPSVIQLFQKARSQNGTLHSGYLLLKGVHYNRVYCVLFKEKKKLYIYRTHTSPAPNIKLRLKGATYKSFSDSKSVAASTSNLGTNGTLTSAVDDVPTEVDKFYKLARGRALPGSGSTSGISGIKREPITYLQIETQTKACTFRIEGTADAEAWQQGIQKAGATLAKD